MSAAAASHREAEIVAALGAVRSRIAEACRNAGRNPQEITLVAVTKTYPAHDVLTLARLGVTDIGENRDQEARAKIAELSDLVGGASFTPALRWHVIGRLQTNKARSVVRYATAVHSVDRVKLAVALGDAAQERRSEPLDVFVQVSLDGDPERGGAPERDLAELTDAVAAQARLRLRGLMAVPPKDADADVSYAHLAELAAEVRRVHPEASALSAGMTGDLEAAVRYGSTHLRIGTALLGRRPPVVS